LESAVTVSNRHVRRKSLQLVQEELERRLCGQEIGVFADTAFRAAQYFYMGLIPIVPGSHDKVGDPVVLSKEYEHRIWSNPRGKLTSQERMQFLRWIQQSAAG
jgi:hypothetical protein